MCFSPIRCSQAPDGSHPLMQNGRTRCMQFYVFIRPYIFLINPQSNINAPIIHTPSSSLLEGGFTKSVGTGSVRPVPGGTGPTRYLNRSDSHPKNVPKILESW
jgi:hypothetical protein